MDALIPEITCFSQLFLILIINYYIFFQISNGNFQFSVYFILCIDRDCAIWREAIQLSTSRLGKVDVVCFPWAGGACVGTGNRQSFPFLSLLVNFPVCASLQ